MSAGTKVFLAVFGVMVGAMVLYYTTVGGEEGEPPVVRGAEDPLVATTLTEESPRSQSSRRGIVRDRSSTQSPGPRSKPKSSPETTPAASPPKSTSRTPTGRRGTTGAFAKPDKSSELVAALPAIDNSPPRAANPVSTRRVQEPKPDAAKPDATTPGASTRSPASLAAVNVSEKTDRTERGTRQPKPRYTDHFVRPGETMSSIAASWFGDANKWELIAKANPMVDPNKLQPGDLLRLPAKELAPAAAPRRPAIPTGARTYEVRSGDSLSSIAGRVWGDETRWNDLYEANRRLIGPDPHRLAVGMRLVVPK